MQGRMPTRFNGLTRRSRAALMAPACCASSCFPRTSWRGRQAWRQRPPRHRPVPPSCWWVGPGYGTGQKAEEGGPGRPRCWQSQWWLPFQTPRLQPKKPRSGSRSCRRGTGLLCLQASRGWVFDPFSRDHRFSAAVFPEAAGPLPAKEPLRGLAALGSQYHTTSWWGALMALDRTSTQGS